MADQESATVRPGAMGEEPSSDYLDNPNSEIVLAVAARVGTDLDAFERLLDGLVRRYGWSLHSIRLSRALQDLALDHDFELVEEPEVERLKSYMNAGDRLRELTGKGSALALLACAAINRKRETIPVSTEHDAPSPGEAPDSEPDQPPPNPSAAQANDADQQPPLTSPAQRALPRQVHLLRSLKHPEEVLHLRRVYGPGFFLIGLHLGVESQKRELTKLRGLLDKEADEAIERDRDSDLPLGQRLRDTFELSDVFIDLDREDKEAQLSRFLDLVFGAPHVTPTSDEHAMFMAYASS